MSHSSLKLGLKLWSKNDSLIPMVADLYQHQIISHLELHLEADTKPSTIEAWAGLKLPIVVHAPNESVLDLSDPSKLVSNLRLFLLILSYADLMRSNLIIVHPGTGTLEENLRQLSQFADHRLCLENMPGQSLHNGLRLNGSSFADIQSMRQSLSAQFCLDIGHAIVAANHSHIPYLDLIKQFLTLQPTLFHINDGLCESLIDNHLHFGDGNFPLRELVELIPAGSRVSLETPKNLDGDLSDFVKDVNYLHQLSA